MVLLIAGGSAVQYMILIYGDEKAAMDMSEAEMQDMYAGYMAYNMELARAGVLVGAASLQPIATARTVRLKSGEPMTTDGPFAETKEQLGGYYIIDVPNRDEAMKWAAKCPGADGGSCEVRPLGIISNPDGSIAAMQE